MPCRTIVFLRDSFSLKVIRLRQSLGYPPRMQEPAVGGHSRRYPPTGHATVRAGYANRARKVRRTATVVAGHQQSVARPRRAGEPIIDTLLIELLQISVKVLQLSPFVIAVLVATRWVYWAGYYTYFAMTPQDAGLSIYSLLVESILFVLVPGLLTFLVFILVAVFALKYGRAAYWVVVGLIAMAWQTTDVLSRPDYVWAYSAEHQFVREVQGVLGFGMVALLAATAVRRTRRSLRYSAACALLVGLALTAAKFNEGQFDAESDVTRLPFGTAISNTGVLGIPFHFVYPVIVHGVSDAPPVCGLLLGTGNGAYVVRYSMPPGAGNIGGANGIWRFPVGQASLETCDKTYPH